MKANLVSYEEVYELADRELNKAMQVNKYEVHSAIHGCRDSKREFVLKMQDEFMEESNDFKRLYRTVLGDLLRIEKESYEN